MTGSEASTGRRSGERRRAGIRAHLDQQGYSTVQELSAVFGVSDMTIRRDVQLLVNDGALRSVHGGVTVLPQTAILGTDFGARAALRHTAKQLIAARAVDFLPQGGGVGFDSGTTVLELATLIPDDSGLHVVTPSLAVVNAMLARDDIEVTCLAGTLQRTAQSFSGPATVAAIAGLRVRTLFLAASGITEQGVYCGNDYDAVTKRALVHVADEVVLLADSSKFTTSAMVRACSLDDVDRIITDSELGDTHRAWLGSHGVAIEVVDLDAAS